MGVWSAEAVSLVREEVCGFHRLEDFLVHGAQKRTQIERGINSRN